MAGLCGNNQRLKRLRGGITMDEKVRELLKQRQQIQEEADMAMAAFKSAKGSLAEIDEEILASMKADGASKLIDDTGKIKEVKVFKFSELSEEIQEKALNHYLNLNVDESL
jgi:hypothetical protein